MAKKGYWIVAYQSISDGAVMGEYGKAAQPAVEAAGGRLMALGAPAKAWEGGLNLPGVVVEFDSIEKAVAAYETPAYKAAAKILEGRVKRDFRIVEGV
jgi:uncharacterized protein (DUF1330 family)